jgi:hypothetical protein
MLHAYTKCDAPTVESDLLPTAPSSRNTITLEVSGIALDEPGYVTCPARSVRP